MVGRSSITITTRDGTMLGGWFYGSRVKKARNPCIIMSHGFSGEIKHGLENFAERFAAAGLSVIVYDHRNFGLSGGEPRFEANPFQQVQDMRDVVTFATLADGVDPNRIGIWGTSYSGGEVLMLGAVDRRVKCVVSLVPVTSGYGSARRLIGEMNWDKRLADFAEARRLEMQGKGVQYQVHTTYPETLAYFAKTDPDYANKMSIVSHEMFMDFEPVAYIHRIAPTPMLMIITSHDTRVCSDLQLEAYEKAREPKKLVILKGGGHYSPYIELFEEAVVPATEWFVQHLAA
jgi:uncharacterized protein